MSLSTYEVRYEVTNGPYTDWKGPYTAVTRVYTSTAYSAVKYLRKNKKETYIKHLDVKLVSKGSIYNGICGCCGQERPRIYDEKLIDIPVKDYFKRF
jgi:hypothetical protein